MSSGNEVANEIERNMSFVRSTKQRIEHMHGSIVLHLHVIHVVPRTSRSDSKNDLPSCDDFSSIEVPRDDSVTFSNPLFEFDVNFNNPLFDEELEDIEDDIEFLLHKDPPFEENDFDLEYKMNDEAECFNPGGDNDEIDAFLAIKVPTYIEGYYYSEGDFIGELITIPPGIVREHEDYINRMPLLFANDSIPPGIESDFDSEEDIIDNLLNDDPIHERLTFNMEPNEPVINNVDELNEDECFDLGGGEINVKVDNSFTFVTWIFLPYLTYPEVSPSVSSTGNEDTIFDPGIST
ncbi:hypothetical protein Tco_0662334 [Tanacetum coccineum]